MIFFLKASNKPNCGIEKQWQSTVYADSIERKMLKQPIHTLIEWVPLPWLLLVQKMLMRFFESGNGKDLAILIVLSSNKAVIQVIS